MQRPAAEPDPGEEADERRDGRGLQHHGVSAGLEVAGRPRGDRLVRGPPPDRRRVDARRRRPRTPRRTRCRRRRRSRPWSPRPARTAPSRTGPRVRDGDLARERLERAGGREPLGALRRRARRRPPPARRAWSTPWPRRTGRCSGDGRGRREAGEQRVGRRRRSAISSALSAARRAPSGEKSFVPATPIRPSATTRTRMPGVLPVRALVDRARREPREPAPFVHEQDLDAVGARQLERGLRDAPDLVGPDEPRHQPRHPDSGRCGTARATAPWPTRATWPGWPLPQFGVPHSVQSSRPPTASHEPQNSVVMPV